jgi:hypothetical protein
VPAIFLEKIQTRGPGVVAQTYNPICFSDGYRRFAVQGQSQLKLARSFLKNKLDMVVHTCDPSYFGGRGRKIEVQCQPRHSVKPNLKNNLKQKGLA